MQRPTWRGRAWPFGTVFRCRRSWCRPWFVADGFWLTRALVPRWYRTGGTSSNSHSARQSSTYSEYVHFQPRLTTPRSNWVTLSVWSDRIVLLRPLCAPLLDTGLQGWSGTFVLRKRSQNERNSARQLLSATLEATTSYALWARSVLLRTRCGGWAETPYRIGFGVLTCSSYCVGCTRRTRHSSLSRTLAAAPGPRQCTCPTGTIPARWGVDGAPRSTRVFLTSAHRSGRPRKPRWHFHDSSQRLLPSFSPEPVQEESSCECLSKHFAAKSQ